MAEYGYGQWGLVFLNVVLFGLFLLLIPLKRKVERRSASVYLAFIIALYTEMLTLGMIVQWVILPTLLMWPILTIAYYRLARQEEKEMEKKFGVRYREYKRKVPMFIPFPEIK
jgi:hypothetical protein